MRTAGADACLGAGDRIEAVDTMTTARPSHPRPPTSPSSSSMHQPIFPHVPLSLSTSTSIQDDRDEENEDDDDDDPDDNDEQDNENEYDDDDTLLCRSSVFTLQPSDSAGTLDEFYCVAVLCYYSFSSHCQARVTWAVDDDAGMPAV